MARKKPSPTNREPLMPPRNPGSAVLEAADLHNAAQGKPTAQAANLAELETARVSTIHIMSGTSLTGTIAGELPGGRPVQVLVPLDHPALCKACRSAFDARKKNTGAAQGYQPVMVAR